MKHSRETLQRFKDNLANKEWRLNNLYYCKDENGIKFLFKPNPCQQTIVHEKHPLNIILKARQLGITTFYCINFLDDCLFNSNITAVLIGDDLEDAKKILRDKVKYAYDRLPDEIKELRQLMTDSTEIMRFSNGSSYSVTTSARSGTVQRLHITEFGKICRKAPDKAEEIMSGSLNTVHQGQQIIIESTAQGASGYFFKLCDKAERQQRMGEKLTLMDWKFHFFGWQMDKRYQMKGQLPIDHGLHDYFHDLDNQGIGLTDHQKLWYIKKNETQGDLMKQEFPCNSKEAFEKAIIGAYFAKELMELEKKGRITQVSVDDYAPVHTAWDIGLNDLTCIWFVQKMGLDYAVIDYYEMSEQALPHYINMLREKGYNYGLHLLPHDSKKRSFHDGKTAIQVADDLGVKFTHVARTPSKIDNINEARILLKKCWFDIKACATGLTRLREYRKKWNKTVGAFMNDHEHDDSSHAADGFRTFASSIEMIKNYAEDENDYHEQEDENYHFNSDDITGY